VGRGRKTPSASTSEAKFSSVWPDCQGKTAARCRVWHLFAGYVRVVTGKCGIQYLLLIRARCLRSEVLLASAGFSTTQCQSPQDVHRADTVSSCSTSGFRCRVEPTQL